MCAKTSNKTNKPTKKCPVNPSALIKPLPYSHARIITQLHDKPIKHSEDLHAIRERFHILCEEMRLEAHVKQEESKLQRGESLVNLAPAAQPIKTNPRPSHLTHELFSKLNHQLIISTLALYFASQESSKSILRDLIRQNLPRYQHLDVLPAFYRRFHFDDVLQSLRITDPRTNAFATTTILPTQFIDEALLGHIDADLKQLEKTLSYEWLNKDYLSGIIHKRAFLSEIGHHLKETFALVYACDQLETKNALPLSATFMYEMLRSEEVIAFGMVKRKLSEIGKNSVQVAKPKADEKSGGTSPSDEDTKVKLYADKNEIANFTTLLLRTHPPDFIPNPPEELTEVWFAIIAALYLDYSAYSRPDLTHVPIFRTSAHEIVSNNYLQFSLLVYTYFQKHFDLIINPYIEAAVDLNRCLENSNIDTNLKFMVREDRVTGEYSGAMLIEGKRVCEECDQSRAVVWRSLRSKWHHTMDDVFGNRIRVTSKSIAADDGMKHPRIYVDQRLQKMGYPKSKEDDATAVETDANGEEVKIFIQYVAINNGEDRIGTGRALNKNEARKRAYEDAKQWMIKNFGP